MDAEAFVVPLYETWAFWRAVMQIASMLIFICLMVVSTRRGNRHFSAWLKSEQQNFVLHQELVRTRMQLMTVTEELNHIRRLDQGAHTAAMIGDTHG